jgi:hypothetical protein
MLSAACIYAASRSRLWSALPDRLQQFLRRHHHWAAYTAVALVLFGVGSSALYVEVSQFDMNRVHAHWANTLPMWVLTFIVNLLIWADRKMPWAESLWRWIIVTLVATTLSQILYWYLTSSANVWYLAASALTALAIGIPHYIVNDKGVFKRKKQATMA